MITASTSLLGLAQALEVGLHLIVHDQRHRGVAGLLTVAAGEGGGCHQLILVELDPESPQLAQGVRA